MRCDTPTTACLPLRRIQHKHHQDAAATTTTTTTTTTATSGLDKKQPSTQHHQEQGKGQVQDQDKIGTSKMPRRAVLRTVVEGAGERSLTEVERGLADGL